MDKLKAVRQRPEEGQTNERQHKFLAVLVYIYPWILDDFGLKFVQDLALEDG